VGGRLTVKERVESGEVVSVLVVERSTVADSGVYQCRSTSDRSVATRRVHVITGKYGAIMLFIRTVQYIVYFSV